MARPPTPLYWGPPTEAEALLAERERLAAQLAAVEARLWALACTPPPAPVPPVEARWLSIAEAARRFHWHPDSVRRWARAGDIRAIQHGGRWRVLAADLEAPARGR